MSIDQIVANTKLKYPTLDASYLEKVLLQINHKGYLDPLEVHQLLKAWYPHG